MFSCSNDYSKKVVKSIPELIDMKLVYEYDLARFFLFSHFINDKCATKCCLIEGTLDYKCNYEYLPCNNGDFILKEPYCNSIKIQGDTIYFEFVHCDLSNPNCKHLDKIGKDMYTTVLINRSHQKVIGIKTYSGIIWHYQTSEYKGFKEILNDSNLHSYMKLKDEKINPWFMNKYWEIIALSKDT